MAGDRFSISYPVQGALVVAHAPHVDGDVLRLADLYTMEMFQALWKVYQERDASMATWPAILRDWNLLEGAWGQGDAWHAYDAAETSAALAALVGRLPDVDVSRVHPVDGGPPGTLAEALAAFRAFVEAAPGPTIYLLDD